MLRHILEVSIETLKEKAKCVVRKNGSDSVGQSKGRTVLGLSDSKDFDARIKTKNIHSFALSCSEFFLEFNAGSQAFNLGEFCNLILRSISIIPLSVTFGRKSIRCKYRTEWFLVPLLHVKFRVLKRFWDGKNSACRYEENSIWMLWWFKKFVTLRFLWTSKVKVKNRKSNTFQTIGLSLYGKTWQSFWRKNPVL